MIGLGKFPRVLASVDTFVTFIVALSSWFKTSAELRLENLALRQQLGVLRRSAPKRLRLTTADRAFWISMKGVCAHWDQVLMIVKPETVLAWHRKSFRLFWTWRVGRGKPGRAFRRKSEI